MSFDYSGQNYYPYPNYCYGTPDIIAKGNISNALGQRFELITFFDNDWMLLVLCHSCGFIDALIFKFFFTILRHANSNALKAVVFQNILLLILVCCFLLCLTLLCVVRIEDNIL